MNLTAVLRAEDGTDHGRTCVYQRRAELRHSAVNDLVLFMEQFRVTLVKLSADDAKLCADIVNACDVDEIQNASSAALAAWADAWQLSVSILKCCVLNVGNSTPCIKKNCKIVFDRNSSNFHQL